MTDPHVIAYGIVAMACMVVLEVVIRQVESDELNQRDPLYVSTARRLTFLTAQAFLFVTAFAGALGLWQPSWVDVGLVLISVLILAVNIVSLHLRSPPPDPHGSQVLTPARRRPVL